MLILQAKHFIDGFTFVLLVFAALFHTKAGKLIGLFKFVQNIILKGFTCRLRTSKHASSKQ